jgi:hypothetical protein
MPVSYTPLSGADIPFQASTWNTRFQSIEDYFLALIGSGAATQTSLQAEAGEGLGDRSPAYINLSDNKIYQMDSDAAGPKAGTIRGFVDGTTTTGNTATLVIAGLMDGFSSLSGIAPVYVGTIAGTITQTKPAPSSGGSQVMIAEMGISIAADTLIVRPRPIQYQKRDDLALNASLSVQHHTDASGYLRQVWAYITEIETGASLATYGSANRDSDVGLSNQTVASYGADQCSGGTPLGNMTSGGGVAGAFDNNAATFAQRVAVSGTIGYDFGSNKTIRQYTVQETTGAVSTQAPRDWTFEYSSDNTNWNVADTQTAQTGWTDGEIRTFTISSAFTARYWRMNITNNNGGGGVCVGELEMKEVATYTDGPTSLAQTFNLGSTSTVQSLGLWLKKVGSPTGTVTVRIETVSAGNPTGTLAHADATQTLAESSLSTSYSEVAVTFTNSFSLNSGDYAIVLTTTRSPSELNYIHWGADGSSPGYASGDMRQYSGSWASASKDSVFTVYSIGLTHPSAINVDWWGSALADMVNRYGDGSGADLTTKTTFKCKAAAGFSDVTIVVELP